MDVGGNTCAAKAGITMSTSLQAHGSVNRQTEYQCERRALEVHWLQHDHDYTALRAPGGEPAAGSIKEGFWVIFTPEFAQALRLAPIFVA